MTWLRLKQFDDFSKFEKYYLSLDEFTIDLIEDDWRHEFGTEANVKYYFENLQSVIKFYDDCLKNKSWVVIWIS